MKTDMPVTGVALDRNHARINVLGVPDTPGVAARVFAALGEANVSVDMIIQGVPGDNSSRQQMAFTVNADMITEVLEAIEPVLEDVGGHAEADESIAKLSIVGLAVGSTPGLAGRMFAAIAATGANIEMIATSEVRVSVVILADKAEEALAAVHGAFGLERKTGE
jgi:aspartate kinase